MNREEKWILEEKYDGSETSAFEEDRRRLASGEPVAYVIGWQPFLGLKIRLDSRPLIPRPETEWWVEQMLAAISEALRGPTGRAGGTVPAGTDSVLRNRSEQIAFLDLCAGSGAIGCAALAALPHAKIYFGEIDPAHEATIRKNIRENHLDETRADVRIGDLFTPFGDLQFDFIAANPPYIPEHRELPESVSKFEPAQALFAGDDGLALIRRIAAELPHRLKEGGEAWIECDSAHAETARALCETTGLSAELLRDQHGAARVIRVKK